MPDKPRNRTKHINTTAKVKPIEKKNKVDVGPVGKNVKVIKW